MTAIDDDRLVEGRGKIRRVQQQGMQRMIERTGNMALRELASSADIDDYGRSTGIDSGEENSSGHDKLVRFKMHRRGWRRTGPPRLARRRHP